VVELALDEQRLVDSGHEFGEWMELRHAPFIPSGRKAVIDALFHVLLWSLIGVQTGKNPRNAFLEGRILVHKPCPLRVHLHRLPPALDFLRRKLHRQQSRLRTGADTSNSLLSTLDECDQRIVISADVVGGIGGGGGGCVRTPSKKPGKTDLPRE